MGKREAAKGSHFLTDLDAMITQLLKYKDNICRHMEIMVLDNQSSQTDTKAPAGLAGTEAEKDYLCPPVRPLHRQASSIQGRH